MNQALDAWPTRNGRFIEMLSMTCMYMWSNKLLLLGAKLVWSYFGLSIYWIYILLLYTFSIQLPYSKMITVRTNLSLYITLLAVTLPDFDIYYVKPTYNSSTPYVCPTSYPCHTLQYYMKNEIKSNSTFQFLPGIHILESNEGNTPTTIENIQHSKNQIVVLANNVVTMVAWLSFPC